ncbi:MAG: type II secretion system secretin GspD [Kiritimatiellae bacterium]|jgi:general secretion pathway protein D|nr:type II secretion system secretin GspD [Kiritimatiellia bacterium]
MKKIRDHLMTTGICLVVVLSVFLADAQAPVAQAPVAQAPVAQAPVAQAPVAQAPVAPAQIAPVPAARKPVPVRPGAASMRKSSATSRLRAIQAARSRGIKSPESAPSRMLNPTSSDLAVQAAASIVEPVDNGDGADGGSKAPPGLKFNAAPVDIVLQAYAQETGKTLLMAPDAPKANITLNSQPGIVLSREEYVEAIEVVLSMNGIVLEPFGDKFIKVLARKTVRTEGIKIIMEKPEGGHPEKSKVVSQMIKPKFIALEEAKKAIEGFKKPDGMIQTFERTNSLLVTDIQENVNRMLEIITFIDQPIDINEDVHVVPINFAKAEDIKKRIDELVAESQKATAKDEIRSKKSGSPGVTKKSSTASSISSRLSRLRSARAPAAPAVTPNAAIDTFISDADRGMIRGKVQIIADERTNKLIFITSKENMEFFERIIAVLDVETTPDVKVQVLRLEYADAEEVSTMLNELIGNATSKKDDSNKPTGKPVSGSASRSKSLAEAAAARVSGSSNAPAAVGGKSKLGQLSKDSIKILADKRTNAIVMMGSMGDLAAITEIIKSMDIMLSQVLIETVVLEVGLTDSISTGINWVRRINGNSNYRSTVGGGSIDGAVTEDLYGSSTNSTANVIGGALASMSNPISGIEYFMTLKNLNLDAVVKASQSDANARILSSPVLLTVDNKEASIEATELRYMYKGMRYMGSSYGSGGGTYEPDVEQRDVGLTVKVTPRINPNGNVILTIEETFENIGTDQEIQGEKWPTVTTRKLSADVSVGNGETVILGGLVQTTKKHSESGVPYLKDIPYIGKYLFGSVSDSEQRSEMLVFLTPYVIDDPEQMREETRRRKEYIDANDIWTKGWSNSDLADPVSDKEMELRLTRNKKKKEQWRKYGDSLREQNMLDSEIKEERENTLGIQDNKLMPTNMESNVGLMTVESSNVPQNVTQEDENIEPQRPEIKKEKRSWWKLF